MKLIRFGKPNEEKPGIQLDNGKRIDVSAFCEDFDQLFFAGDEIDKLRIWLQKNSNECPVIDNETRLGPPMARPSKIVCVGLNYAQHAAESRMAVPKEPVIFFKSTSAIVGPNDDLIIPKGSTKTDWEVELAVVIGKKASYLPQEVVMNHIVGYMLHNDYSERSFQIEREGQWCKGKGCDTFAPIGPFLATKDEIENPNNLELWLHVNGEKMQHSTTSDFIFKVSDVISYISQFMTLLPGDIVSTGTPSGVGFGFDPPRYLKPGDVVELGIEGLGTSRQVCKEYTSSTI